MTLPAPLLLPRPANLRPLPGPSARVPEAARAWLGSSPLAGSPLPAFVHETQTAGWCGADDRDAQGSTLRLTADSAGSLRADLVSPTAAGLRHARATLVQLLRQFPTACPQLEIADRPALALRGVMLDVSRCRIPTNAEFLRILDTLAELKCNHLQLYTEHTFAYTDAEEVWSGWDPLTPADIRALDAAARLRGIELTANQNCFGHLAHWLEHPRFAPLAETHGDWMFDVWPRSGPFSLCPTDPASLAFVRRLLRELLPCFSSGLVNIGCDETYDIAYGRSADAVRARGRGVVFAEFVARIAEEARLLGKRSLFWGDIALSHPACLALLPRDMIALPWNYEPDAPWDDSCRALREAGLDFWLCPGTSSWLSLTGRTTERRANIARATRAAVEHGAGGLLICDWGDHGHWQTWPIALLGIADGLAAAWEGSLPDAASFAPAAALHLLAAPHATLAHELLALGDADLALREIALPLSRPGMQGRLRNKSALFADLLQPWAANTNVGPPDLWREARGAIAARASLPSLTTDASLRADLSLTLDMALLAADRALLRRTAPTDTAAALALARRWSDLEAFHRERWLARSRPGGLQHSCAFWHKVAFA